MGKRRFAGCLTFAVEPRERIPGHMDLAAQLDERGNRVLRTIGRGLAQLSRQRTNCQCVQGDVVTLGSVAARHGADNRAVPVGDADRHAVDLRFHEIVDVLVSQLADNTFVERPQVLLRVGLVETQHRLAMPSGGKISGAIVGRRHGGNGRRDARECALQFRKLPL